MLQRVVSRFCVEIFLSHSAEKFRRGNLQYVTNFGLWKDFMLQRVMSRFCVENFLSHSAEKFRRGALLICVSEIFWYRKNLWIRGGRAREYHDLLSKIFCLTVPKNFVGETFSVSLISGIERFYASESYATIFCRNFFCLSAEKFRRGNLSDLCFRSILVSKKFMDKTGEGEGVSRLSVKIFLSHSAKKFRRGNLQCVTNFGQRKILCFRDLSHDFVSIFFCLSAEKFRRGNLSDLCIRKILVSKKIMDKRGGGRKEEGVSRFPVEFFMSSAEKFRKGILLFLRNILVSKSFMDEKGGGVVSRFSVE